MSTKALACLLESFADFVPQLFEQTVSIGSISRFHSQYFELCKIPKHAWRKSLDLIPFTFPADSQSPLAKFYA